MGAYAEAKESLDLINKHTLNFLHPDGLANVSLMYRYIHKIQSLTTESLAPLFADVPKDATKTAPRPAAQTAEPTKEVETLFAKVFTIGLTEKEKDRFAENRMGTALSCDWFGFYQKVANELKSRYPTETKYIYLWLAATAKLARELGESKQADHAMKAMIMSKLVARGVSDILKKTLAKEESAWRIRDGRDFRLVLELAQVDSAVLLDIASSMVDPESPLGLFGGILNGDVEFLWALLDIWANAERWQEIWDFLIEQDGGKCSLSQKLRTAYGYDYRILSTLLRAVSEVEGDTLKADLKGILDRGIAEQPSNREIQLSSVQWARNFGTDDDLTAACQRYFDQFSNLATCYKDLVQYLNLLSTDGLNRFGSGLNDAMSTSMAHPGKQADVTENGAPSEAMADLAVSEKIQLGTGLTYAKILCAFGHKISVAGETETSSPNSRELIKQYVSLAVANRDDIQRVETLGNLALTLIWRMHAEQATASSSDDFLSAPETTLVTQGLALISTLNGLVPDPAPMLLLMGTLLSWQLGLATEAHRFFQALDVKSLLFETDFHIFSSRLSATHPFPLSVRTQNRAARYTALELLDHPSRWVSRSISDTLAFTGEDLETLHPDKLTEVLGFRDTLTQSTAAAVRALEYRRAARLSSTPTESSPTIKDTIHRIVLDRAYMMDLREYAQLPDYTPPEELSLQKSLMVWEDKGIQGLGWIQYMLRLELTADLLWTGGKPTMPAVVHEAHAAVASAYQLGQTGLIDGLAPPEQQLYEPWEQLTQLTYAVFFPQAMDMKKIAPKAANVLTAMTTFIRTHTKAWKSFTHFEASEPHFVKLPTPHFLQPSFLFLEYLQAVQKLVKLIPATTKPKTHPLSGKIPVAKLTEAGAAVEEARKIVQEAAQGWIKELKTGAGARHIRERIMNGEVGEALKPLMEGNALESTVNGIKASAIDALEGVTQVEVSK